MPALEMPQVRQMLQLLMMQMTQELQTRQIPLTLLPPLMPQMLLLFSE